MPFVLHFACTSACHDLLAVNNKLAEPSRRVANLSSLADALHPHAASGQEQTGGVDTALLTGQNTGMLRSSYSSIGQGNNDLRYGVFLHDDCSRPFRDSHVPTPASKDTLS